MWKWWQWGRTVKVSVQDKGKCRRADKKGRASVSQIRGQKERILGLISRGDDTIERLHQTTKLDKRTLQRRLQTLMSERKIERVSAGYKTHYRLIGKRCKR